MATHPRIFLTPAVLARAKARVQSNHAFWTALKAQADKAASWDVRPINYAAAYVASGNTAYADRALQLAGVFISQGVDAVTGDSGFPCRQVLPEEALVYDWCFDRLSASERSTWRAAMEAQARWVWPETNSSRAGAWGTWWSSNYAHGFAMTWMIGLALQGESSTGDLLLSQAIARFKSGVAPRMNGTWLGGYLEEGTNYGYGSLHSMAQYLTAHLTATGDTTLLPANWYPNLLRATIHLTTPDRRRLYPGGDQARVSTAPVSDYTRSCILGMMDTLPPEEAGMAQFWLQETEPTRDKLSFLAWQPLLWQSDVPEVDYRSRLSPCYTMPGMGVVSTRGDWTPNAVQVVSAGGPVIEDAHQDQAGSFMLWRGTEWLAGCQKIWSSSGIEHEAPALNVVLIAGKKQVPKSNNKLLFAADTPEGSSWAYDLSDTYDEVTEWRRELLFVKPNRLVIFDRVKTPSAGTEKRWLMHTKNALVLGTNAYRATAGGANLFGASILPAGAALTQQRLGNSSRLSIQAPAGGTQYFLQVLEAAPGTQANPSPVTSQQSGTTVTLSLAGIAVQCDLGATTAPALRLSGSPPPPPANQPPVARPGGPYQGVVGQMVQFDGSGSLDGDGTLVRFRWVIAGVAELVTAVPQWTFSTPGTFTVTLTVTDDQGATHSATTTATITAAPEEDTLEVTIGATANDVGASYSGTVRDSAPLPAGSTITVTARKPDGATAQATATIPGSEPPPPPPTGAIYLEAEAATLVAPVTLRTVAGASGGKAIGATSANAGSATWNVTIPRAGTWYLWARVIAATDGNDSWNVSVDGQTADAFDCGEEHLGPQWQWVRLNGRGGTSTPRQINPRTLSLTAGAHQIRFAGRERETLLDRIALSQDAAFRPSDTPDDQPPPQPPPPPPPPPPTGAARYAAPTGSAPGQGTQASPWDLATALQSGRVKPGETLYLRGGTYRKLVNSPATSWTVGLAGTQASPIHIRPAPGERAILDGSFGVGAGVHDVWWWDLHFLVSAPPGNPVPNDGYLTRPTGGWHATGTGGTRCKLVNCSFESCSSPIGVEQQAAGFEVAGCVFWNCGYKYVSPELSGGHDIYLQNRGNVPMVVRDTIHLAHFGSGYAIHAYGSEAAALDSIHCIGNVIGLRGGHWQIGGSSPVRNAVVTDNVLVGENMTIGQVGAPQGVGNQVKNNVIIDAELRLNNQPGADQGNTVIPPGGARPGGVKVLFRPNVYDAKRGTLTILNWSRAASQSVNLGTWATNGTAVRVLNPADLWGTPVKQDTYNGSALTVPTPAEVNIYVLTRG